MNTESNTGTAGGATTDLPRIGPPTRPGPFREDTESDLSELRDQLTYLADVLVGLVDPQLEDEDEIAGYIIDGADSLDNALSLLERGEAA